MAITGCFLFILIVRSIFTYIYRDVNGAKNIDIIVMEKLFRYTPQTMTVTAVCFTGFPLPQTSVGLAPTVPLRSCRNYFLSFFYKKYFNGFERYIKAKLNKFPL